MRGMDDAMVEPFQEHEAARHHRQAQKRAPQHGPAKRAAIAAAAMREHGPRLPPIVQPAQEPDQERSRRQRFGDVARDMECAGGGAEANGTEDQTAAAAQRRPKTEAQATEKPPLGGGSGADKGNSGQNAAPAEVTQDPSWLA